MPLLRHKEPLYRFALYGRAASGKTCILAALAMQRQASALGFTCTAVINPPGLKRPSGDPSTWDPKSTAAAYYLGRTWLDQAIKRLSDGDLPPPNPNRDDPLRYLFHFTEPEGRSFQVKLTDYSGELIDAEISGDEMAVRLQAHLRDMDGILVLAEVPRDQEGDNLELAAELHRLEQAFVTMRSRGLCSGDTDTPVALLLNKWDRLSEIDHDHPDREERILEDFLNKTPSPPHQGLANVLKNSVSQKNFRIFPVSAFGSACLVCDETSCREKPARINPLPSFNLEAPFVWCAIRKEENEITRFSRLAARRSTVCLWKCSSMLPAWSLLKKGGRIAGRLTRKRADEFRKTLRTLSLYCLAQTMVLAIILILAGYAAEAMIDGLNFRAIVSHESNPAATAKELTRAEDWFEAFYRSPAWRHLFARFAIVDRDEALERLKDLRDRREAMLWDPVTRTEDYNLKAKFAGRYLSRFGENGRHVEEAFGIISRVEIEQGLGKNRAALSRVSSELEAMLTGGTVNPGAIKILEQAAENLPLPNQVNKEILDLQEWLLERLSEEKINLARKEGEAKTVAFREKYEQLLKQNHFRQAADLIKNSPLPKKTTKKFRKGFPGRLTTLLAAKVQQDINARQWNRARYKLSQAAADSTILSLATPAAIKKIRQLSTVIDQAQDRFLYREFVKFLDRERAEAYLEKAPIKKMRREVESYRRYLDQADSELAIKVSIATINWGESCSRSEVIVRVDGRERIDLKKITAREAERSAQLGEFTLKAKPSERIRLGAETICHGFWSSERSGLGVWAGRVADLDGLALQLSGKGEKRTTINLKTSGMPVAPELPPWR